jgi:hypothetical protein
MKIKELTVSVSQKLNLGNYESKGYGFSATALLNEKDDVLITKEMLTKKLNQFLEFELNKIIKQGDSK